LYNQWAEFQAAESAPSGGYMIQRIQLVRNIGQFDSVSSAANLPLARLTIVYAENGRGKTTLAAILRSLAGGDPVPIAERKRLAAAHPPHVVLDCAGGPQAIFQNNAWNRQLDNIAVFDDQFVDENVCSGLAVDPQHRQNLHELILGAQGVALNRTLQACVQRIEQHNTALRNMAAAIPLSERGPYSVDDFCELPAQTDIDTRIQAAEREVQAVGEKEPIRTALPFDEISLPEFNVTAIEALLQRDLTALDSSAADRVQAHLSSLAQGAEAWVAAGMRFVPQGQSGTCPFCAQDLGLSPVINHYRAYFSQAYADLKQAVADTLAEVNRLHGGEAHAAFERAVRVCGDRRQFWSRFCDVAEVALNTLEITRSWRQALDAVTAVLQAKQAAPLERMALSAEVTEKIAVFDRHRQVVAAINQGLQQANDLIRAVKERAAGGDPVALAANVARLKAVKARHESGTAAICQDYLDEKAAKSVTEAQRDQARTLLERYRAGVFPQFETAINEYLRRFNAGFRLDKVAAANTRAGSACNYCIIINDLPVAVDGAIPVAGEPTFRSTLSSGDRNALALAFFFASLDMDQAPDLIGKVVVIDDPISSLDEHRSLTTVQEIRGLAGRVAQVIVLSHNKPFLCRIWEHAPTDIRTALEVARDAVGSTIRAWDVNQDCVTEHDRRHALFCGYLENNTPDNRKVAESIRPHLEAFLRIACPECFPPGKLLGPFHNLCQLRVGTAQQILDAVDLRELHDLNEYAKQFHHDTNPAWQTMAINDTELVGFVQRTLEFARRR
jgi:wobble nucleotide-excising tRNase